MKNRARQLGSSRSFWLIVAALVIGIFLVSVLLVSYIRSRSTKPASHSLLPDVPTKARPLLRSFNGCPPEGDDGDPELNRLKNRVDEGQYILAPFDAVEQLDWPKAIERRGREYWSDNEVEKVSRYEGLAVSIEGYLAGSRLEGPESPNCHGADSSFRDFHIWLTKNADEDRTASIVVEMIPALRAQHLNWTIETLNLIHREKYRVRVSGWLLLDPDHPDQVGRTRGTIWEIHPVTRFEVEQSGQWLPLDEFKK
jgi:hypothetical protein